MQNVCTARRTSTAPRPCIQHNKQQCTLRAHSHARTRTHLIDRHVAAAVRAVLNSHHGAASEGHSHGVRACVHVAVRGVVKLGHKAALAWALGHVAVGDTVQATTVVVHHVENLCGCT